MRDATDVVVAGGSVAGCALAALLGRQGANVTVLEKSPKPEHYKVVCSHFIQAGATPVLQRLGIDATMERAGALRNGLDVWTAGGWYTMPDDAYGYNLRREKLDPMLRELAARTPNVTVRQGVTVDAVLRDGAGRPSGLRGHTPGGEEVAVDAKVVVGADGRGSQVARLAGIPGRVQPHNRFGYMAYYEDLELDGVAPGHSQMWLSGRDVLYCFPNDDGVTIAAVFLHKDRLAEFKADKEAAFLAAFAALDRAPDLASATRISPMIGKLDLPNVRRPAGRPGIAFVGDAAQASDPVWGVGVG
ncbi:MAG: FAD-dependent monooxygenase, partial [Conexibacter sp.]|nr:FAD-dependent monooxygenase [Conexibacter sp.]